MEIYHFSFLFYFLKYFLVCTSYNIVSGMTQGLSLRWQFIILNFSSSHRRHFLYVPVPVPVIYLNMYSSKVSDSGVFSVFLYEKDRLSTYCIKYAQRSYLLSIFNTNMKALVPRSLKLRLLPKSYFKSTGMAWSASHLYLHEKINSLVASKVIDHMTVQELRLLGWNLMIHI